jgi:hypothetical protein
VPQFLGEGKKRRKFGATSNQLCTRNAFKVPEGAKEDKKITGRTE